MHLDVNWERNFEVKNQLSFKQLLSNWWRGWREDNQALAHEDQFQTLIDQ